MLVPVNGVMVRRCVRTRMLGRRAEWSAPRSCSGARRSGAVAPVLEQAVAVRRRLYGRARSQERVVVQVVGGELAGSGMARRELSRRFALEATAQDAPGSTIDPRLDLRHLVARAHLRESNSPWSRHSRL